MKLSSAVQESLITLLLHDGTADGGKAVRALIPPQLYDPFFKQLAEAAHGYWEQYKQPPKDHTLDLINTIKERDKDSASVYDRIFTSIEDNKSRINKKYILDQAGQFARLQRIKATTHQTLQVLKRAENGDRVALDEAEALMQRVGRNVIDLQDCGLLLNDPEQALSFLKSEEDRITFRTGIKELDRYDLGPTRKKYHLTIAPTGTGKSWAAMQWGRMGLIDGARVVHITCEMTAEEVAQRYVQSLCSVRKRDSETIVRYLRVDEKGKFDGLDEEVLKRPSLADENIRGVLLKGLKPLRKRPSLYIKEFPSGKATVRAVEAYLDNLEATRNFTCDICIAEGSLVLTDRGLVPIEQVRLEDKVWDGLNWVGHKGVICKGVQDVITHCGLTATPDHEVWTKHGWRTLIACQQLGLPIAQTGMGGKAVRIGENYLSHHAGSGAEGAEWEVCKIRVCAGSVPGMPFDQVDPVQQSSQGHRQGVPEVSPTPALSPLALSENAGGARSVHQFQLVRVDALRRAGDQIQLSLGCRRVPVGDEESPRMGEPEIPDRPEEQRRPLRAGELATFHPDAELLAHQKDEGLGTSSSVQATAPRGDVFRIDPVSVSKPNEAAPCGDSSQVEQPRARAKVYDIVDAGPLHRFTVQGLLVHNCIVDYPDLFDHDPKHKRQELEKITVDLRGLAGQRNMAVAGFSQANEKPGEGGKRGVVSTGRAAEGRAKEHTADIILTLNQTPAEYELGLMRAFVAKARGDLKGFQVLISQALNAGQFVISSALMNKNRYWSEVGTEEANVNEGDDDGDE